MERWQWVTALLMTLLLRTLPNGYAFNACLMSAAAFDGRGLWKMGSKDHLDITSTQNPRVKMLRSFHKRQVRDREGKVLVEGHRLVCDLVEAGQVPSFVMVSREALRSASGPRLQSALETLPDDSVALASQEVVQRCCDTVTAQGVVAVLDRPSLPLPVTMNTILICDGIHDPGNLGTLVRAAAGLGADAVVLTGNCVDCWSPKTLRACMGTVFRLPVLQIKTWEETTKFMQSISMSVYAADGGASSAHYEVDWSQPSALVVGSEAEGLGKAARHDVESGVVKGVRIPLAAGVESLNAAIAGAIVLGEAQRQRIHAQEGKKLKLMPRQGRDLIDRTDVAG